MKNFDLQQLNGSCSHKKCISSFCLTKSHAQAEPHPLAGQDQVQPTPYQPSSVRSFKVDIDIGFSCEICMPPFLPLDCGVGTNVSLDNHFSLVCPTKRLADYSIKSTPLYFYIKLPLTKLCFQQNKSLRPLGIIMDTERQTLAAILQ